MELVVQKREKFGKAAKTLRKQGLIPAELYGRGIENIHLTVPAKEFHKVFKQAGESSIVNIVMEKEKRPVLVHDIAIDPVSDEILNVDFYQVRLDEKIKIKVPLVFTGEAPAVKDKGGVLVKAMHDIEIEALPGQIPHAIEVSLGAIAEIGQSVHVGDLVLPAGVRVLVDPKATIATVTEKAAEEEVAVAPEVTVESVKVETEEKKAERVAKKEAASVDQNPSDKKQS